MSLDPIITPPHICFQDKVILFDGVCKLCNAWCNFIIKHDKHHVFKLASVQSDVGEDILKHFDQPTDVYKTMLVVRNNTCLEKSDAFFYVMSNLRYPYKLINVLMIIPKPIRDWLYDRIALNRYALFGKYDSCILPDADHDNRYLCLK